MAGSGPVGEPGAATDWQPAMETACRKVLAEARDGRVLVGFSGGRDSTVLLHLLARLKPDRLTARITALHLDHGLHADSPAWSTHCAGFCTELGVEFVPVRLRIDPGPDLEARARQVRYTLFAEHLGPDDLLLLAHHADDQAESLLLHLLQGRGAFGIPRQRRLAQGRVARPFIELPAEALAQYARVHRLGWVEDPSNHDVALDRNYLRHELMPVIEARFPHLGRRLGRVETQLLSSHALLTDLLGLDRHPLPLALLKDRALDQQVTILRLWLLAMQRSAGVSDSALAEFARQSFADADRSPELRQAGLWLRRYRQALYLVDDPPQLAAAYEIAVPGRLELPHGELRMIRVDSEPGPVTGEAEGSVCVPTGSVQVRFKDQEPSTESFTVRGHHRSLSELLRAAAVPPWERSRYPLLFDELGLLAIPGIAVRDPPSGGRSGGSGSPESSVRRVRASWHPHSRKQGSE